MAIDLEEELLPLTQPTCSARDRDDKPCPGTPHIHCPKCLLVSYCDEVCRQAHWEDHKATCSKDIQNDPADQSDFEQPVFNGVRFWGEYAATDILNLEKNEGAYYSETLNILLSGNSSLRHLIYSVVNLPETASPKFNVVISEVSAPHVVRTLFSLLLLFDRTQDPALNAEAVVHLWYSAKMTTEQYQYIEKVVGRPLERLFADVDDFYNSGAMPGDYCRGSWSTPNAELKIDLNYNEWLSLRKFLAIPSMSHENAQLLRLLDLKKFGEPLGRALARMTRARAAGMMKWRQDGILLPYGHPRDGFDVLNPILFTATDGFAAGATAEPLCEWPMELLDYQDCPAPNDVYGKMFFYVRHLLVKFQLRLRDVSLSIHVNAQEPEQLPGFIYRTYGSHGPLAFDRIEVGDLWDVAPLVCFVAFSRFLRHQDENPFATMLTITRESVTQPLPSLQKQLADEELLVDAFSNTPLDKHVPPVGIATDQNRLAVTMRRRIGLLMWRSWDQFSDRFLNSPTHDFLALDPRNKSKEVRSVMTTGLLGMQVKSKNTIARRWPNRLIHAKHDNPTTRDFNRWVGWADNMPERWMEWKRTEDFSRKEWLKWYGIAVCDGQIFPHPDYEPESSTEDKEDGGSKLGDGNDPAIETQEDATEENGSLDDVKMSDDEDCTDVNDGSKDATAKEDDKTKKKTKKPKKKKSKKKGGK